MQFTFIADSQKHIIGSKKKKISTVTTLTGKSDIE